MTAATTRTTTTTTTTTTRGRRSDEEEQEEAAVATSSCVAQVVVLEASVAMEEEEASPPSKPACRGAGASSASTTGRGRMLREASTRVIKLLALLAIDTHGPFRGAGGGQRRATGEEARLLAARRERLLAYVDSLSEVLALAEEAQLRELVEAAAAAQADGVGASLVTEEEGDGESAEGEGAFVAVRRVRDLVEELAEGVRASCPRPQDSAWLALILKVLVTYQVRANMYDARARASCKRLARRLGEDLLPWKEVAAIEAALAVECLAGAAAAIPVGSRDPPSCQSVGRYAKVALAAVGGGALMVYTGSVAAPSIAASLLAICSATGGAGSLALAEQLAASTAALLAYWGLTPSACISTLLGATGVGLTGYKMSQRTRGVTEFHFVPLHSDFPLDPAARTCRAHGGLSPSSCPQEDGECEDMDGDMRASVSAASATAAAAGPSGLPVFICIPGWVEEDQDPRRVWGGATTTISSQSSCEAAAGGGGGGGGEWEAEMVDAAEAEEDEDADPDPLGASTASSASCALGGSWEALDVATSGWWREVVPGGEEHVLVWERQVLGRLHRAMREFVWDEAARYAVDELIKHTALASLTTAAALPLTVLDAARKLDNPWQMAGWHAEEAGRLLADVLAARPQGSRPVTLLGYSMGARLVFHCLEALHAKGEAGLGIVENAVLLGAPVGRNPQRWRRARAVVAGRLINGYSTRDWALQFLFRSKAWELGLAGVSPVGLEHGDGLCGGGGVENVDLTEMVAGHLLYPKALPNIMAMLRLEE